MASFSGGGRGGGGYLTSAAAGKANFWQLWRLLFGGHGGCYFPSAVVCFLAAAGSVHGGKAALTGIQVKWFWREHILAKKNTHN